MKHLFLAAAGLLLAFATLAQPKVKFGNVSKEELSKEASQIEADAHAEVLYESGSYTMKYIGATGITTYLEYYKRIKIYDTDGYDYADVTIPFYNPTGASGEQITFIKGYTYNLEGDKVVKTKLDKENILEEEVVGNWSNKKITFPKVKEGSIIEYKYTKTSTYVGNLPEWTFQEDIPVVWSEFDITMPEFYEYRPLQQGSLELDRHTTEDLREIVPGGSGRTYNSKKNYYAVANAKPLEQEPYISSTRNYSSKISFQIVALNWPGEPRKDLAPTYHKLNQQFLEQSNFKKLNNSGNLFSETVEQLTAGKTNREKALILYTYVRDNMLWNDRVSRNHADMKKAWKEKMGTSATINAILTTMLKTAGLQAEPVILSTRSHGMLHPVYPDRYKFNYQITAVNLDDSWVLLDASRKGYPFATLPVSVLNGQGWMISETNPGWISLQGNANSSTTTQLTLKMDEHGVLEGDMKVITQGYDDLNRRREIYNEGEEEYVKNLSKATPDWTMGGVNLTNKDDIYKPLISTCHLVTEANEDSEIIYLSPIQFGGFEENPFKSETRIMPVDIPYGSKRRFIMVLEIPEGYSVDEVPESTAMQLPDKGVSFRFTTSVQGNKITVLSDFKLNKLFYSVEEYKSLRNFFELMIAKQNEQIVLKKTT